MNEFMAIFAKAEATEQLTTDELARVVELGRSIATELSYYREWRDSRRYAQNVSNDGD